MSDTPIQDSKEETTRLKAKIAELEAQVQRWRTFSSVSWTVRHSVADELDKEGCYLDERDMNERVFDTDFLNKQIKRLRGKEPEQYNYDTPAKPATDHEEVAPDPDIQKQREKKSNA